MERVFGEHLPQEEEEVDGAFPDGFEEINENAVAEDGDVTQKDDANDGDGEETTVLNRDNMELVTGELREGILEFLRSYHRKTPGQIVQERYDRFRRF